MKSNLSTDEVADIANVFYKQLRAATVTAQERLAVVAIVNTLANLEAVNDQV